VASPLLPLAWQAQPEARQIANALHSPLETPGAWDGSEGGMCSTGWHSGGELYEHKVVKRALGRTVSAIVHALVDVRMCALKLLWVTWQIQARKDYDTCVYTKYLCSRISIYIY